MLLIIALAAAPFACTVLKVRDGDGPLWCTNGVKVRVAGKQAPDFERQALPPTSRWVRMQRCRG